MKLCLEQTGVRLRGRALWRKPVRTHAGISLDGAGATRDDAGVTLVELIITIAILSILATAALPVAKYEVKRAKERELRADLWTMRKAIDNYYDAAKLSGGQMQTKVDSFNYPPDLDTLVKGVTIGEKRVKFLRAIPVDPMTGTADWNLKSMQDDPDSDTWGGQNVFDVHSNSPGTALDGTKYNTW